MRWTLAVIASLTALPAFAQVEIVRPPPRTPPPAAPAPAPPPAAAPQPNTVIVPGPTVILVPQRPWAVRPPEGSLRAPSVDDSGPVPPLSGRPVITPGSGDRFAR